MKRAGISRTGLLCAASAIGILTSLSIVAPAVAQDAPAAARRDSAVSEVVVTAGKREQDLQDVAASVTAFTSEMRDETGIVTAQGQLNFTPGVSYNPGFDRVTIRGIGRVSTQIGTDAGVAVYQDGFYVGSVTTIGGSTLTTERVEVLRGPQGTLYGRNSIGGAVNAISRRPTEDFHFDARTSVNNYGGVTGETRVAGGLAEGLSGSLAIGGVHQTEGYYKNVSNSKDEGGPGKSWNVDAQLKWSPNENFDTWIRYFTLNSTTHPRNATTITRYGVPNRGTGAPNVFYGLGPDDNPGVNDHYAFSADRQSTAKYDNYHQVIGEATWHADSFDIKYLGGYRTYDYLRQLDGNATDNTDFSFPYDCGTLLTGAVSEDCDLTTPGVQKQFRTVHNDITQDSTDDRTEYSHEINLTSTGDGPLQYILGAYYFHSKQRQDLDINFHNETAVDHITVPGTAPDPSEPGVEPIYHYTALLETTSKALFGQVDYQFTPTLKATLGARYSKDEKKGYEENIYVYWLVTAIPKTAFTSFTPYELIGGSCPQPGSSAPGVPDFYHLDPTKQCPVARNLEGSWDAFTGTAGLEWTPSDDTLVYGKFSKGYKSGGFNLGTALAMPFVGSEKVNAYEAGWKQTLNDRLQFNAAAFYYDYRDMQAPVAEVQGPTGQEIQVSILTNLPKVQTYGLELESTWNPIDPLRFLVNYSYLHTEIKKGCCYADVADPLAEQPGAKPIGPVVADTQPQTVVGNELAGSPHHKVAVNGTYTWDVGQLGSIVLSATWNWRSDSYQTFFNNPLHVIPGGDSTDVRATWAVADTGVTIIGTVSNVFDQEVATGFFTDSPARLSFQSLFLEPPRIYTLEVRYSF